MYLPFTHDSSRTGRLRWHGVGRLRLGEILDLMDNDTPDLAIFLQEISCCGGKVATAVALGRISVGFRPRLASRNAVPRLIFDVCQGVHVGDHKIGLIPHQFSVVQLYPAHFFALQGREKCRKRQAM